MFNKKKQYVGIAFDSTRITLSCITKPHPYKKNFHLMGYEKYPLYRSEYKEARLYNITLLKKQINAFFKKYALENSFVSISLAGSGLTEKILSISTELPQEDNKKLVWDYMLIQYNQATRKYHYYLCGVTREQLFQYQLLALLTPYNCIKIIPQRVALLYACTHLFPHQQQTTPINNHASLQKFIHYCIDQCDITSLLAGAELIDPQEKLYLVESFGLFLSGAGNE